MARGETKTVSIRARPTNGIQEGDVARNGRARHCTALHADRGRDHVFVQNFDPLARRLTRRHPGHGTCAALQRMILWSLRGSSSEFVCSIEKGPRGYRLVVRSATAVIVNDVLPDVRRARWKANVIRDELLAMGYTAPV